MASTKYHISPNAPLTSRYGAARHVIGSTSKPIGPNGPHGTRSFNATVRMPTASPGGGVAGNTASSSQGVGLAPPPG
ncbi:hypothetical protein GCM10009850_015280 [Nonomuraea monospora]|uniref:Uncharacterized protein n=1 Tax=Nonomuraea monospora TaxID=568818 RepID=A0ABN3C9T3_9ACTN